MTSGKKTIFSLLLSTIIFSGITLFAFLFGFKLIEVKFYEPRVVESVVKELDSIGDSFTDYFNRYNDSFSFFMSESTTVTYLERSVDEEVYALREDTFGKLREKFPGLEGARLIDADESRIHFSTYREDVLKENEELVSYRDYASSGDIPYTLIQAADSDNPAMNQEALKNRYNLYFDSVKNRLVFSYPVYDRYTAYRGSFVFYIGGDDFSRFLVNRDVVSLNTRGIIVAPKGFVFALPVVGRDVLCDYVSQKWDKKLFGVEPLVQSDSKELTYFLISSNKCPLGTMGWICNQDDFIFSEAEKILLLCCVFITLFLLIFLLFNLRHDDMVVINNRIKKFQYTLLKEYIERKDSDDWKNLAHEIASRKVDVNDEFKKSLGRRGKKYSEEIDRILDKSWTEVMSAMAGNVVTVQPVAEETNVPDTETRVSPEGVVSQNSEVEELEDVEALDAVEELEDVEEIEEIEEAEAVEEVEELEEIPDAEPVEDVEDLEEIEELEEIPEEKEQVREVTFEQFEAERYPDEPESEPDPAKVQIKKEAEESFNVSGLDFSDLD